MYEYMKLLITVYSSEMIACNAVSQLLNIFYSIIY